MAGVTVDDGLRERPVLHRDLGLFLVDLSIALHRHPLYPPGHPALLPVLNRLARRADTLLQDRPRLAIGVAHNQLVIEGVATDPGHPLLGGLAERLHRHHLSVVEVSRGLTTEELAGLIEALAQDPDRGDGPLGARQPEAWRRWPHVGLHPVTLGGLTIVADAEVDVDGGAARCAQLWIGLANAALERTRGDGPVPELLGQPAVVARAIDEHQRVDTYDQVVVGYLLQIAEELRTADGSDAAELRRRTGQLLGSLQPETLKRLLDMGGDSAQRQRFLSDVATGMAASAVVDVVEAAAAAADETVSSGLLRLLSKLAAHAEMGAETVRPLADSALREQVRRLIADWQTAGRHPQDYRQTLQRLGPPVPPVGVLQAPAPDDCAAALQVVEMSLELAEDSAALSRAVDTLVRERRLPTLVELLRRPDAGALAEQLRVRVATSRTVRSLLDLSPPDFTAIGTLLPWLEATALTPLFDVMLESENRQHRRATFDLLRGAGANAVPLALERLTDTRWYVIRNLLALIATLQQLPAGFDPFPWLSHHDGRVRREALRIALRLPDRRLEAIRAGIGDSDPSVLGIVLAAVQESYPSDMVPALVDLASREGLEEGLRASALRALGTAQSDPRVLDLLLRQAGRDARRLPWQKAVPKTAVLLAALAALDAGWSHDRRADAVLRRARASADPQVRQAAGGRA